MREAPDLADRVPDKAAESGRVQSYKNRKKVVSQLYSVLSRHASISLKGEDYVFVFLVFLTRIRKIHGRF
jgi:hypothetical protein